MEDNYKSQIFFEEVKKEFRKKYNKMKSLMYEGKMYDRVVLSNNNGVELNVYHAGKYFSIYLKMERQGLMLKFSGIMKLDDQFLKIYLEEIFEKYEEKYKFEEIYIEGVLDKEIKKYFREKGYFDLKELGINREEKNLIGIPVNADLLKSSKEFFKKKDFSYISKIDETIMGIIKEGKYIKCRNGVVRTKREERWEKGLNYEVNLHGEKCELNVFVLDNEVDNDLLLILKRNEQVTENKMKYSEEKIKDYFRQNIVEEIKAKTKIKRLLNPEREYIEKNILENIREEKNILEAVEKELLRYYDIFTLEEKAFEAEVEKKLNLNTSEMQGAVTEKYNLLIIKVLDVYILINKKMKDRMVKEFDIKSTLDQKEMKKIFNEVYEENQRNVKEQINRNLF